MVGLPIEYRRFTDRLFLPAQFLFTYRPTLCNLTVFIVSQYVLIIKQGAMAEGILRRRRGLVHERDWKTTENQFEFESKHTKDGHT